MPWRFTGNVEIFAERTADLLRADPVAHTLPLGIVDLVRRGVRWSDQDLLFGWFEDHGRISGATCMTPPFELILAVVPDDTVASLVAGLRDRRVAVPGVHGDDATVERFVAEFVAGSTQQVRTIMRMRLYALETLRAPTPLPPGRACLAGPGDLDLMLAWKHAFHREAGVPDVGVARATREQIYDQRLWLWRDEADTAVALAGRNTTVAGVARIGPVYTPPEHRRHGYGAAVTAACTAHALGCGAGHVALFADLVNPISNSIYRRIGYRHISDRRVVHFPGTPVGTHQPDQPGDQGAAGGPGETRPGPPAAPGPPGLEAP